MKTREYAALVLNDYEGTPDNPTGMHYATNVMQGLKTIETRSREFRYRGDLVICCGKRSVTTQAGLALCIVNYYECVDMLPCHEAAAMIGVFPKAKAMLLKDWRYFSTPFPFAPQRVSGAYQSIFTIRVPDGIEIIPQPQIVPYSHASKQLLLQLFEL